MTSVRSIETRFGGVSFWVAAGVSTLFLNAARLHEQINEDDPWFGRLTFTRVNDVGPDGCILVQGCSLEGCGSFLLIPPQ